MERRINYPIGAVSTIAYCVLFAQSALFASMAINAFLSVYLVYGWLRWKADEVTLPVTKMSILSWVLTLIVAGTGYLAVVGLATWFGGTLAWTDSLILVGTIMAQFMMDNKKIANWGVWAVVNIFAIYTYFHAGLALAGFQYIFFLANTAYGYYMWRKSHNEDELVS
jgi:nicotinamide mononucleotide transporter